MDNAIYVGLSRQMMLRRELDVIANNIANADTSGFKVEDTLTKTEAKTAPRTRQSDAINFVIDDGVARNFGQGGLNQTSSPLDLAIEGQGFFTVNTPAGPRYTRDGRFTLDSTGRLATQAGAPVLGAGGGEIVVDPLLGPVAIAKDGTVSQGINIIGKVEVSRFDDLASLRKDGDNLFRNVSNQTANAAPDARIHQGMLESSNVKTIEQVTRLIEVNRAYDSISKMMADTSDLSRRSIERIGKLN
ncbi:MAG: flagellar basal body rod protein [Devosia sp.]|uniref:flagellar basal-body rod protein FlgF n=1 Tax=Devosia sp. TaxID=1871048 RepID=UPI002639B998|nr:flagellar basal-body rod protein FlgF [Devosia sp.]MDB5531633.1 flagellar basal body rod protein [Devosia sp.]